VRLVVPLEILEKRIFLIRGHKVMLDGHLSELYQVPTKRLNEAVKRNPQRFPEDFMFRLTKEEAEFATELEVADCALKPRRLSLPPARIPGTGRCDAFLRLEP
jgi:hypothetical protein